MESEIGENVELDLMADSLNGILEIESVEPFLKPLKDQMYNVENIPRAFMIVGAILVAIAIIWFVDKVLVWAVNNSKGEKRRQSVPFYIFPLLLAVAFIIDYISIIFGIFKYPWISFSVLMIKGSIFLTTSLWAMNVFEVPLAKIFSFMAMAAKAWRTKDVEGLDKSMTDLAKEEKNTGKKTFSIVLLMLFVSCFAPRHSTQGDAQTHQITTSLEDVVKKDTIKVYRSAFNDIYLINKAKSMTVKASVVNVKSEERGDGSVAPSSTEKVKRKDIPVYYKGKRVGTFRLSNNEL